MSRTTKKNRAEWLRELEGNVLQVTPAVAADIWCVTPEAAAARLRILRKEAGIVSSTKVPRWDLWLATLPDQFTVEGAMLCWGLKLHAARYRVRELIAKGDVEVVLCRKPVGHGATPAVYGKVKK
jgi:hypothetical protein